MPKLKLPDIEKVTAIDIHTHAEEPCGMHGDDGYDDFQAQMADYFKSPHKHPPTVPETAAYYRSKNIAAVIFPVDAERETGFRRYKNEEMLEIASDHLDVLIPFVSIDPHKGKLGVREARKLIEDYGVRGFKFHPTMQGFYANDRMAYPLYEAINDGGAIALFHTGQTGVGSGMPGGMGMRLKYSNPMYMDDVAADFPDLKIILAHPSFPWQEEALSVATHKPNVYIDLSGWSPKYFPPILVRYINSILQDKMLFGSDWPVITPDRWLADFAKLDIREEIRPKVLKANARRILYIRRSLHRALGVPIARRSGRRGNDNEHQGNRLRRLWHALRRAVGRRCHRGCVPRLWRHHHPNLAHQAARIFLAALADAALPGLCHGDARLARLHAALPRPAI